MPTLTERARVALADELPGVDGALLDRYAGLVAGGGLVTEHLVHDEWEAHHGEIPLALDQRPGLVHLEIVAAAATIRDVAEWLRPGAFFEPGRVYQHRSEGEFFVSHVAVPPPGWNSPGNALRVAFGWRRIERDAPLAGTEGYGIYVSSHHTEAYVTPDYYGWRPMQVTPVSGYLGGDV